MEANYDLLPTAATQLQNLIKINNDRNASRYQWRNYRFEPRVANLTGGDPLVPFGVTAPTNGCGFPLKWRPSDKNTPLFGAYRSKNEDKKYSVETKQCFTLRLTLVFTWRTLTQPLTDENQQYHCFVITLLFPFQNLSGVRRLSPPLVTHLATVADGHMVLSWSFCCTCKPVDSSRWPRKYKFGMLSEICNQQQNA